MERRLKDIEAKLAGMEQRYLTEPEIRSIVHTELSLLNDTLVEIRDTLQGIALDLAPWKQRQQLWMTALMLASGWKAVAIWLSATIGLILAVIGLVEVLGRF